MPKTMGPGRLAGRTRGLLRCGMWAGPAFTATFLAEGAVREGYRPLRHPVSSLALGPRGWIQTANFAVTGVLFLAGAAGLRLAGDRLAGSRTGPVMVAAAGAGLIGSAATAVTMPVTMALAGAGFGQSSRLGRYGGLFQRASIIAGFAWLTAVSARALHRTPPGTAGTS
jgi:Protein of unknown function (DUF998)